MEERKELPAYMTLEVSLLFPIIVLLLVSLVYFVFYKYNEVTAFQNASIVALYGKGFTYEDEEKEELTRRIYGVLEKLNDDQYIAISSLEQKVEFVSGDIIISQDGNMIIPFLSQEMVKELFISEKVTVDTQNSTFYIRQMRKVRGEND